MDFRAIAYIFTYQVVLGSDVLVLHSSSVVSARREAIDTIFNFLNIEPDLWRTQCLAFTNLDYFKVIVFVGNPTYKVFFQRKSGKLLKSPYDESLITQFKKEILRVSRAIFYFLYLNSWVYYIIFYCILLWSYYIIFYLS